MEEKRWYYKMFNPRVTNVGTMMDVTEFLNRNKLKPEDFKVTPTHVHHKGYDHSDDLCGFAVLYYSDVVLQ